MNVAKNGCKYVINRNKSYGCLECNQSKGETELENGLNLII